MPNTRSSPIWDPKVHADRRPALLARGRVVGALRAWFAAADFVEVETGALQVSPGNEMHLHAFATTLVATEGTASPLYLRTSPEFACKKLLAAGERRIVEFAKVFRNRERGALHAPEFTLIEWYRAGEPYQALMADCAAILAQAAQAAATKQFSFRGRVADPLAAPERLTVAEAFEKFAGIDLLATLPDGKPDRALFAHAAQAAGIRIAEDDRWGDIFSRVLVEHIEGNLGLGRATILDEYPAEQAALARTSRKIRALPNASSFMSAASKSPTASPSSPTPRSSTAGSNARWRRNNASTASAIRSTRIFWQRWRRCRKPPASRLGLIGW